MIELKLPRLSMTMEDAAVTAWLVEDGADVAAGDDVVEIETDKAQTVLEAPANGSLHQRARVGDVVALDGVLAVITDAVGTEPESGPAASGDAVPAPERQESGDTLAVREERADLTRASPVARRAIAELGVDPATITGTGVRGMITLPDVHRAYEAAQASAVPTDDGGGQRLRQAVVANLVASWERIPHIHVSGELSAEGLVAALATPRGDPKITVTDLLLISLARALGEVPELNGTVDDAGQPQHGRSIDINLAVATDDGVVAPLIRSVSHRTLSEVAHERSRLVDAARRQVLDPNDLATGTCTLSNLGTAPVDFFAPIVTGPQIALVATGRVRPRAIVEDGKIVIGNQITVNVALDHRAADGAAAGRLLEAFERSLATLPDDAATQKGP